MRGNEKIFKNTNPNILKMINIHDAEEVYESLAKEIEGKIKEKKLLEKEKKEKIEKRLK